MRCRIASIVIIVNALTISLVGQAVAALTFTVTSGSGVTPQVLSGFNSAAAIWSGYIKDDINVNITLNVATLADGETGTSNPVQGFYSYASVRSALIADSASATDQTAVAHLQAGPAVSLLINRTQNNPNGVGSATPYLDNNGDANNITLRLTNANAKSLGLVSAGNSARDATITFNNNIAFDYDRSNGIAPNQIDFVGVATHEIGHVLGFFSGVDVLDRNSTPPDFAPDSQFQFVTVMDLYRYSTDSVAQMAIDWTDDTRSKFISFDGGATSVGGLSTGTNYGDGYGASHWKDNLQLGIMDPTFAYGELGVLSARDLQLMDAIGYQTVPEPVESTIMLLGVNALKRTKRSVSPVSR